MYEEITSVEELDTIIAQANERVAALVERGRNGEQLTSDELAEVATARDEITAANERRGVLDQAAADAAAQQAELLDSFTQPAPEPVEPAEPVAVEPVEPEPTIPAEPVAPVEPIAQEPAVPAAEPVPVAATSTAPTAVVAAAPRQPVTTARRQPAPHARRPRTEEERNAANGWGAQTTLVAAANSPVANRNATIDWAQAEEAFLELAGQFVAPSGNGKGRKLEKTRVAQLQVRRDDAFVLTGDEESDSAKIAAALDPRRTMANGAPGLLASGGWCAPSEILYDIPVVGENATDGILSLPEMVATRGGVRSTVGPVWSDVFSQIGFHQTETQAIAGETKDCFEVPCVNFTETRLDVEGVCLMVPILTEAGYPEVVARYMAAAATVHARKMNAFKIGQIVTASTPKTAMDLGSTAESTLDGLAQYAEYVRWQFRMGFDEVLEVGIPHWVLNFMLTDLELRMGHDPATGPLQESDLQAWFAARKLSVQWLYEWQEMAEPTTTAPASFVALMYPAGTWLGLTKDVINLGAVYDSNGLSTNVYTGMFSEEGVAVRKMTAAPSYKVTIPICSKGRVGAANLTCS